MHSISFNVLNKLIIQNSLFYCRVVSLYQTFTNTWCNSTTTYKLINYNFSNKTGVFFCRVPVDRVATTARRWVTVPTPSQEGGYSTWKLTGWHLSAYTRRGNQCTFSRRTDPTKCYQMFLRMSEEKLFVVTT